MIAGLVDDLPALLAEGARALTVEGDLVTSRQRFDAAYQFAQQIGDHQAMAAAALGCGGLWLHEYRNAAGAAMLQARLCKTLAVQDPASPPRYSSAGQTGW
jgi:hypothetical protein